jgi:hypothetical protein
MKLRVVVKTAYVVEAESKKAAEEYLAKNLHRLGFIDIASYGEESCSLRSVDGSQTVVKGLLDELIDLPR